MKVYRLKTENFGANVEDNKSDVKVMLKGKKSRSSAGGRSKVIRSYAFERGHIPDKKPDMVAIMSKLLRQQAAPDVEINIFTGDPFDYHYFIAVFGEMFEKIDDPQGRITRLIKYIDSQPEDDHCIQ